MWKLSCASLALVSLAIVFAFLTPTPPTETLTIQVVPYSPPTKVDLTTPRVFDSQSYYRTIIDNNLFRPLGWTPPRRVEPYRLIGTRIGRDDETPPEAILERTGSNLPLIVSIGDMLDSSTEVVAIEGKQVVLETAGKKRTLRLSTGIWLNPSRATHLPVRQQPTVRPPSVSGPRVASPVNRSSSRSLSDPARARPLSEWRTREGEPIRVGDARLKQKSGDCAGNNPPQCFEILHPSDSF